MKPVEIHRKAREIIRTFSKDVRNELGSALTKLQLGMTLGFPLSRPMPGIHPGAHELRLRDSDGIQRIFYFLKSQNAILLFHAFAKKSQKTPANEMETGRRRLQEMLSDEKT